MIINLHLKKALYGCLIFGMLFSTLGAGDPPGVGNPLEHSRLPADPGVQPPAAGILKDFGPISPTDGWILTGSRLYWTSSNGQDWSDITPALSPAGTIYSVEFLNAEIGWTLWGDPQADGSLSLQLARTSDQGRHWTNSLIQVLAADDPIVEVENAGMDWLDEHTGWVNVKQQTGSNFSSGAVFRTMDGGQTWERFSPPLGEPVHFVDSHVGWMAGGPAGNELFKSQDGGETWENQPIPGGIAGAQGYSLYPPVFDSSRTGLLPVVTQIENDFQLDFYLTGDGGQTWSSASSLPLGPQVGRLSLSLLDARNGIGTVPGSDRIIHLTNGVIKTILNRDGMSAGIVDLKMRTSNIGWAKWRTAACSPQAAADGRRASSCTSTTQLIQTRDGGSTWEPLAFPENSSASLTLSSRTTTPGLEQSTASGPGKTLLVVGQGFDICTIPSLAQLQTWWNTGSYQSVNLYIGGVARMCPNTALTADYVNQMRQQGWAFIPTWVGPQAPCTNYNNRFSYNVNNAFNQGKDEAYYASAALAALGLTNPDKSGSVVYYDMEIYANDAACRGAVNAFVNGWVSHMHDMGNLAGVYGATGLYTSNGCTSGLSDYLTIPHVPDVIWPARWYSDPVYDPNASVWDIGKCIPATAWNNHQRIRQYAGDHSETWGGVTLNGIDDDVLDGVAAVPFLGTPSPDFSISIPGTPPLTAQFTITNTAFISTCSWNYGDGQTGSTCAAISTHTYSNGGTYTVNLTVSSSWGSENLTGSHTVTFLPATTTAITADLPDPSMVGQPVVFTFSVAAKAPASATPTGNVTVSDGTQSCTGAVASGNCSIVFATSGAKTLTATYSGDANFSGSLSTPATAHTVNKANTATTITSDLTDPSLVGQSVNITYTVTVAAPGSGKPGGAGMVTVSDGIQSCMGTVAAGSCSIVFATSGVRTLTAMYTGSSNLNASTSPGARHAVISADTVTLIVNLADLAAASLVGQPYPVAFTVTPLTGGTPTGTVTISDGSDTCTGTVASGMCYLTSNTLGAILLTATYSGDGNYNGSVSIAVPHTVVNHRIYLPLVIQ